MARASSTPGQTHGPRQIHSPDRQSPNWDGETQLCLTVYENNISPGLPSITQHRPAQSRFSPEHSSITQHGSAEPNRAQSQPSLFPALHSQAWSSTAHFHTISSTAQPISSPAHFQPSLRAGMQSQIPTQLPPLPSSRSFPAPVPPQCPPGDPALCQTPAPAPGSSSEDPSSARDQGWRSPGGLERLLRGTIKNGAAKCEKALRAGV